MSCRSNILGRTSAGAPAHLIGLSRPSAAGKKGRERGGRRAKSDQDYEAGKKVERSRWSKVLKSAVAGGGRLAAACEMLSGTNMSSSAIIRTLSALPAGEGRRGLMQRMGASGGAASGLKSFADEMKEAAALVRPGRAAEAGMRSARAFRP